MDTNYEIFERWIIPVFSRLLKARVTDDKTILIPVTERSRALLLCIYKSTIDQYDLWNKVTIGDKNEIMLKSIINEHKNTSILLFADILEKETNFIFLYSILRERGLKVDIFSLKETIDFFRKWNKKLKCENEAFKDIDELTNLAPLKKESFNNYIKEVEDIFSNEKNEQYHLSPVDTSRFIIDVRNILKRKNEFSYGLPITFTARMSLEQWEKLISQNEFTYVENCEELFGNNETHEDFFIINHNIPNTIHPVNHYNNGGEVIAKFGCITLLPHMEIKNVIKIINILDKKIPTEIFEETYTKVIYKYFLWYISLFYSYYQTEVFSNYVKEFGEVSDIELTFISDNIKNSLEEISLKEKEECWNLIKNDFLNNSQLNESCFSTNNLNDIIFTKDIKSMLRFELLKKSYSLEEINDLIEKVCNKNDKLETKITFLKSILCMLSRQEIETDFHISNIFDTYTIFQKGTASNFFVGKDIELMFQFLMAYRVCTIDYDKNDYLEKYDSFIKWLYAYFLDKQYFDHRISEECFNYFIEIFKDNNEDLFSKQTYLAIENREETVKVLHMITKWNF